MKKLYEPIYQLFRDQQYQQVLDKILTGNDKNIKGLYKENLNHAWYMVGDAYYRMQNYDLAISSFKKSLDDWPQDEEAILALANSYSENSLPDKAEKVLRSGLNVNPKNEDFLYNLGNALFDQGQAKEAVKFYERITINPELKVLAESNIRKAKKQ